MLGIIIMRRCRRQQEMARQELTILRVQCSAPREVSLSKCRQGRGEVEGSLDSPSFLFLWSALPCPSTYLRSVYLHKCKRDTDIKRSPDEDLLSRTREPIDAPASVYSAEASLLPAVGELARLDRLKYPVDPSHPRYVLCISAVWVSEHKVTRSSPFDSWHRESNAIQTGSPALRKAANGEGLRRPINPNPMKPSSCLSTSPLFLLYIVDP